MGYDAGILQDESRPAWPYQPEYPDWGGDAWRREITPQAWMKTRVLVLAAGRGSWASSGSAPT
nr:hypothetical protein [Delftia acidovorans]